MFKRILLVLALMCMIVLPVFALSGTYTEHGYFYLPGYGAYGLAEYNEYNRLMQIADTQIEANTSTITDEGIQDIVGAMFTGNTETFLTLEYQDADGTIDGVVPVKDEDDMASDSATHLATQQSIKKYVDDHISGVNTSGTPEANDIPRFIDENTIEGLNYAELKTALGLATINFIDLNDTPAAYDNGKYARSTAAGLIWDTPTGAGDMTKSVYDTDADGDIEVSAGGTERSSWTQYAIPYLSNTTVFGEIPIGTAEYALTVNATTNGYDWTLFDLSLYYLKTAIDTQGEVENIWGVSLVNDGDLGSYYLKTAIDTIGEVETIWSKNITDSTELATALADYYLKTAIDTIGEVETIWVKNITDSTELATALTDYYLKTAIDTQGELETIWGVTLATDTELAALSFIDLDDTPASYESGKYARSTAAGIIWDTALGVDTYGTPVDNDIAVFTDENTIEGKTLAELNLTIGTDIQAQNNLLQDFANSVPTQNGQVIIGDGVSGDWDYPTTQVFVASGDMRIKHEVGGLEADVSAYAGLVKITGGVTSAVTIGIADNNQVEMDDADAADNDFAKFTAAGLEGRSYSETRNDLQNYIIYPQDYATGTGTAIDPWAGDCMDAAYTACPTGGTIYLRAGYYLLANEVEITKQINIIGEGINKTFIITADDVGIHINEADHVTLKGFTVDGTAQTEGGDPTWYCCVTISKSNYAVLEDLEVKESGDCGINLYEANNSVLKNIYAHNNWEHGVHSTANTATWGEKNTYRNIYTWDNGDFGFDDWGGDDYTYIRNNVYDNINAWGNTGVGIAVSRGAGGKLTNSRATDNAADDFNTFFSGIADFTIANCYWYDNAYGMYLGESNNVNLTNVISKNSTAGDSNGIKIDRCNNIVLTSCQSYDDKVTPIQDYGIQLVGTNTNISLLNCKLLPNQLGEITGTTAGIVSWGIVNDDVDLVFGNDRNWLVQYDEAVDDQLLFLTAGTGCTATTDAMFEIIVGATPTANQQVFAVSKGTQSSKTQLFSVDEDGDVLIPGTLGVTGQISGNLTGNVTGNASGSSGSCTGLSATATALATARTIGGVSFDGTANIVPTLLSIATALGDDHTYIGITDSKNVGENVIFGQLLYFDWTDTEWKLAKANAVGTTPAMRIALETKANGEACVMLVTGYIRDDSAFEFTAAIGYLSITTGGAVQYAAPSVAGNQVQRVGIGISADIMYFCPSIDTGEI